MLFKTMLQQLVKVHATVMTKMEVHQFTEDLVYKINFLAVLNVWKSL